ncbi:hypothetical protein QE152_g27403 [Popillia japonica]|uniref:Uncharacterized protein n=1 Tax=Popillia japonica TaxID=7064 RepID=A0AAW1JVP0_POPJA
MPASALEQIAERNKKRRLYQRTRDPSHLADMKRLSVEIKNKVAQHKNQEYANRLGDISTRDGSIWRLNKHLRRPHEGVNAGKHFNEDINFHSIYFIIYCWSPARRLRVSAEIHASADDGPSGLTTPPPRQGPVRGKLFAPQHLGVSDEITVLHSRPATHPPSGTTNEQRRFPPNPSKPTSITASSQPQSRQAQGQNAKDDQKTWH